MHSRVRTKMNGLGRDGAHNRGPMFGGLCSSSMPHPEPPLRRPRCHWLSKMGMTQSMIDIKPSANSSSQPFSESVGRSVVQSVSRAVGHRRSVGQSSVSRWSVGRRSSSSRAVTRSVGQSAGKRLNQAASQI